MKLSKSMAVFILMMTIILTAVVTSQINHDKHTSLSIDNTHQANSTPTVLYWYDPMVPDQKFDKPGKSPFMDMQLVPKYASTNDIDDNKNSISISTNVMQNLGIRVVTVQTSQLDEAVSAVGRVEPDEHQIYDVQVRSAGFIEHLWVRAVGDTVRLGQKIADIYAPELLAAQQEYLALLKINNIDGIHALQQSARKRLELLGMADREIIAITATGRANSYIGIYAPASGVVTELGVREGGQITPNTTFMQISDLSRIWLILEIPERNAARLKIGDRVEATLTSLPTQTFTGRIEYVYPTLDSTSRSLRIRVALANRLGLLKTGMFVQASLKGSRREAIVVPSEAIISTGKRTIIIVKKGQQFLPASVKIGIEQNGQSEVLQGLTVGEEIVASGQFLIDSEASLNGVLARLGANAESDHD